MASAPNTAEAYLRDIALIYRWAASKGVNLGQCLRSLRGFTTPQLRAIAKELCTTRHGEEASRATCIRRSEAVRSFMRFAFGYYTETQKVSLQEQAQADKNLSTQLANFLRHVRRHVNVAKPANVSTDLNQAELEALNQIIHPDSTDNPFKSHRVRIRNYCLIHVAIGVLARKGELVLLEVEDVDTALNATITIKEPSKNNQYKRTDGASLKTSGRCVPISQQLAKNLRDYIDNTREEFLFPRTPSKALFLSTRDGRRLSTRTVNKILKTISEHPNIIALSKRIHPHTLRTTGTNELRSKIIKAGKSSGLNVTEAISYAGGWVQDSPQVSRYSRRTMNERLGRLIWGPGTEQEEHNHDAE